MDATGQSVDIDEVTSFLSNLLIYFNDIDLSLDAIGIDASHDSRKAIDDFRGDLDNGAECNLLDNNPALRLVELIVSNSQKDALANYENVNLFSVAELQRLGETDSLPEDNPYNPALVVGVKMLFKPQSGAYIPNWGAAHSDTSAALLNLSKYSSTTVQKSDGKIAFSEIICLSETTQ